MNKTQYWFIAATTTFSPCTKVELAKRLSAFSNVNLVDLASTIDKAANSTDATEKSNAIIALNTPTNFWYVNPIPSVCETITKNMLKLKASDFILTRKNKVYTPEVTYEIQDESDAEFHINWRYVLPESATYFGKQEGAVTPAVIHTVTVVNSSTSITAVSATTIAVANGTSTTVTVTYADGKTSSDVTVTGGTLEGSSLTIANVTSDVTVTIADA